MAPPSYRASRHYQQAEVADDYDRRRFATRWGRGVDRLEKRALQRAYALLPAGSVVFELACGTGRMTEVTSRQGFTTAGLDISFAMLRNAQRRLAGHAGLLGFVRGQSESLPIRDRSVDAVMTYRFLPHLKAEDRDRVYREIRRVTRRYAVLQFSTTRSVLFWLRRVRDRWKGKPRRNGISHGDFVREIRRVGFSEKAAFFALPGVAETCVALVELDRPLAGRSGGP